MLIHTDIENHGGTFYVRGATTAKVLGPPHATQAAALNLAHKIETLPAKERCLVLAGRVPPPGCEWLIGGGREVRA